MQMKTKPIEEKKILVIILLHLLVVACDDRRSSPTYNEFDQILPIEDMNSLDIDRTFIDSDLLIDQSTDAEPWERNDLGLDQFIPLEVPPWDPPISEQEGTFKVRVLLDFQPLTNVLITQGGSEQTWQTDEQGETWVELDQKALAPFIIFAAHPQARTKGVEVEPTQTIGVTIELTSFRQPDQPNYPYADPGEPDRRNTTSQCGHCHLDINDAWFESPHRRSAKNPIVYDLYTGRGSGWQTEESCIQASGSWQLGPVEGGAQPTEQCYFSISALQAFNPGCEPPCDPTNLGENAYFGSCADCHAPTVNGLQGGGHDLLSVTENAFNYGVSCDFCHHVEQVRLDEPAGVAGRLVVQRPRERASPALGGGGFRPLSFGPNADISNPRMGISPRAHYRDGTLCSGCHQHQHTNEHASPLINRERWPDGKLPNQSTYQEWFESPLGPLIHTVTEMDETSPTTDESHKIVCNSCHMTAIPTLMNSANLEYFSESDLGIQGGWPRPHGETRAHAWWGPRQPQNPLLELSAHLSVSPLELVDTLEGQEVLVQATVSNLGAGHHLPTGEPMRHILLLVEAHCGETSLVSSGGDVIHELGGALVKQFWNPDLQLDRATWPQAEVGDQLRVVRQLNDYYDYDGYGPFRNSLLDGSRQHREEPTFTAEQKGLLKEEAVSSAKIVEITTEGLFVLDHPLDAELGDIIYHTRRVPIADRSTFLFAPSYAGESGFSFARVLTGQAGPAMLPHFVAQDMLRDNRIRPGQSWTTTHRFKLSSNCQVSANQPTTPQVTATLIYRPYPWWLATERGWQMWDRTIRKVQRHFQQDNTTELQGVSLAGIASSSRLPLLNNVSLTSPIGLSLESLFPLLTILTLNITEQEAEQATRRFEPWPWQVKRVDEQGQEAILLDDEQVQGPLILYNQSHEAFALESVENINTYGVSIDQTLPPERVLRSSPSMAPKLWIIPPQSMALLLPTTTLDAVPLISAGYTKYGGRSWLPSKILFSLDMSADSLESLRTIRPDNQMSVPKLPHIQAMARSQDPLDLSGLVEIAIAYQGSPRFSKWQLTQHQRPQQLTGTSSDWASPTVLRVPPQEAFILSVRNLSTTAQTFHLQGYLHQQWIPTQGWSDPLATTWLPTQGEVFILIPPLNSGSYRLGDLTHTMLTTELLVE